MYTLLGAGVQTGQLDKVAGGSVFNMVQSDSGPGEQKEQKAAPKFRWSRVKLALRFIATSSWGASLLRIRCTPDTVAAVVAKLCSSAFATNQKLLVGVRDLGKLAEFMAEQYEQDDRLLMTAAFRWLGCHCTLKRPDQQAAVLRDPLWVDKHRSSNL